jgi:hypothetical protein
MALATSKSAMAIAARMALLAMSNVSDVIRLRS